MLAQVEHKMGFNPFPHVHASAVDNFGNIVTKGESPYIEEFPLLQLHACSHLFFKQIVRFEELYFHLRCVLYVYVEVICWVIFLLRVIRYLCLLGGQKRFHRNRIYSRPSITRLRKESINYFELSTSLCFTHLSCICKII